MRQPVDRYVDRLLRRRRPKAFAPTQDELAVLRTSIDLAAAAPNADEPRPAFVEGLRGRLADRERAAQKAVEAQRPAWRSTPRRRVLAAGALTATGAAAGAAIESLIGAAGATVAAPDDQRGPQSEITPTRGAWRSVADSTALPEGAMLPFDLGSVTGFLRRVSGRVQAVSGICTHQGCRLDLDAARTLLTCPCHGATFTSAGLNLTHPRPASQALPPLPRLPVREQDGRIQVYAPSDPS
jgi:nitrite reductase/ring-hydroxylating ferredoxin subunit